MPFILHGLPGAAVLNLVSSPGAGKTTLLERTIRDLGSDLAVHVIEGDQETGRDAERIHAAGARALQINSGRVCHLEAAMISQALIALDPPAGSTLFIENVGNLVCPASSTSASTPRSSSPPWTHLDDQQQDPRC